MIVIDVGCKTHENEESIHALVGRFEPEVLFGFDPHPKLEEGTGRVGIGGTLVLTRQAAAWVYTGRTRYIMNGPSGALAELARIAPEDSFMMVDCIDLAAFLDALPATDIVLKLDCEGAEYVLLPHLLERESLRRVSLLLVEWHGLPGRTAERDELLARLSWRVPVEGWT